MRKKEFTLKDFKEDEIVLLEEDDRGPIATFFYRYNKFILIALFILGLLMFTIGLGLTISQFGSSTSPEYTYKTIEIDLGDGSGLINLNTPILDDDVKQKLYNKYGNIALREGVILERETFRADGMTITYYSDGSAFVIKDDGTIMRVSALEDGSYGIDRDGELNEKAKYLEIMQKEVVDLENGQIIYYSDGCAVITKDGKKVLVRDGSNIKLDKDNEIIKINPSGISYVDRVSGNVTYFSDGTIIVVTNGEEYVIHNEKDIIINGSNITFPNDNAYGVVKNITLNDGTNIKYYGDGSALVTKNDGEKLFVRKSGDIVLNGNEYIYVIITQDRYDKINEKDIDGGKILIFDNGDAIIKYDDGSMDYVDDISQIKFDDDKITKIEGVPNEEYKDATLEDGTRVIIFDDESALIIDEDGNLTYVDDGKDIIYGSDGNISRIDGEEYDKVNTDVLPDGTKIHEFEDGTVIIEHTNGEFEKVNKDDIVYDGSGNIDYIDRDPINDVGTGTLPDGSKVTDFENDMSLVENPDGSAYITDNDNIKYDDDGNIEPEEPEEVPPADRPEEPETPEEPEEPEEPEDPSLDDPDYTFEIPNDTDKDVRYRLVLEETDDYTPFDINALPAKYVKYELLADGNYVGDSYLNQNIWEIGSELEDGLTITKNTYILYEGIVKANSVAKVDLNLWLDYANMGNDMQNRAFIGTLKAYLWQD